MKTFNLSCKKTLQSCLIIKNWIILTLSQPFSKTPLLWSDKARHLGNVSHKKNFRQSLLVEKFKNNFRKSFISTGTSKAAFFRPNFNNLIFYLSPTINAYGKYKNKLMLEPSIKSYHCCRSVYQKTAQMACKVRYGKSKVVNSSMSS